MTGNISDSLADAEWESIAHALKTINVGVEGKDPQSRRLRAKLGMVRILLYERIRGWNGEKTIDLSLLISSFKTIRGFEKDFADSNVRKQEFLVFLKLLFHKFKKQKIRVKKPLATRAEFKKMKSVVENGRKIII